MSVERVVPEKVAVLCLPNSRSRDYAPCLNYLLVLPVIASQFLRVKTGTFYISGCEEAWF